MNFNTRITYSNVFSDASGAEANVEVGYCFYAVHYVDGSARARLVAGSPRGAEKKAWPAHACRVALAHWALTAEWEAAHAAMYAAA